jgi:hypothetical protein
MEKCGSNCQNKKEKRKENAQEKKEKQKSLAFFI